MTVEPFKFQVQATVLRIEAGKPVGELVGEVVTLYGVEALAKWAADFETNLAAEQPAA